MFSHGCVGCEGITEQGHASPRGIPSICVREAGQMGARLSMRTFQSVGRGMIGTEEACVDGCERRKSVQSQCKFHIMGWLHVPSMLPGRASSPKTS